MTSLLLLKDPKQTRNKQLKVREVILQSLSWSDSHKDLNLKCHLHLKVMPTMGITKIPFIDLKRWSKGKFVKQREASQGKETRRELLS